MNHYEYHKKMQYLSEKLQKGAGCTPDDLSKSFCVTKRTVIRMIGSLRGDGHMIKFDRAKGTYLIDHEN